ncbi:MAG TPA: LPS assembly protein LptD [Verrucomicrobiae bacterium]|nr:LPS assembly protein LptD [Verrucomicrobiae bacterium]
MKPPRLLSVLVLVLGLARLAHAQAGPGWDIFGDTPASQFESRDGTNYFTHGVVVSNQSVVISGQSAAADELTGEVNAEGDVTILDHGHIWRGTNFIYNFKTGAVRTGSFKTFQTPFALSGLNLKGQTNSAYTATNAVVSTDDFEKPAYTIRAQRIVITPGVRFQAYHAVLYLGSIPVFYTPYYARSLGGNQRNFEFEPGYRSTFGAYWLSAYNWYGYEYVDGTIHLDERQKRGLGGGPDLLFKFGDWGHAALRYYFIEDHDPAEDGIVAPHLRRQRQRGSFTYDVTLKTNLSAMVVANYQSDPLILRDFYEGEYNGNVQPRSYAEVTQLGDNYVLDVMAEPRLVNFFETVERLPDIKLDGLRQRVGATPFYYENESSIGYYQREFSDTNIFPNAFGAYPTSGLATNPPNYSAMRADTYHQFTLPETFFGWLNVTPRLGGRLTYYSDVYGLGIRTNEQTRAALNAGVDVSFKVSQTWPEFQNSFFDMNGLRHIIQPDFDYGYAPAPTRSPYQVPQFDYQSPSLRLLPIEFPEYNSIDSISRQNVLRLMLRNRLITKRRAGLDEVVNWAIYTDWNINPKTNAAFSDLFNDVTFRPRSWLTYYSSTRYDAPDNRLREAIESLTIQPTTAWSIALGYRYLINNDPEFLTFPNEQLQGHNQVSASLYYRLNETWAMHISERFETENGGGQEQLYTLYRDLRSWTAGLNFRLTEGPGQPHDFTVALTFSLKSFPRFSLYSDTDQPINRLSSSSVVDPYIQ